MHVLRSNSREGSRVPPSKGDARPWISFPSMRLSLAVRGRFLRAAEDLPWDRLLSASGCPGVRRGFAGRTRPPPGVLGLVILLLPAMSVAHRLSPGARPTLTRGPASVATSPGGFQTKALDEPLRRNPAPAGDPRRSDEPRPRCAREEGVGRSGRSVR